MNVQIEFDTENPSATSVKIDGVIRNDITSLVFTVRAGRKPSLQLNFGKDPYDED